MTQFLLPAAVAFLLAAPAPAQVLDRQKLLDAETFWDNRDWDWYKANIPFFECPDKDIQTTYYYRWEVVTKHLTCGSPNTGYTFTEFIDRPFWSGAYGAISCPAGHQLYEVRWLNDPRYARDYARYWFRTPGAQPRRYSTWLADAVWAVHRVHPDAAFATDLLPDLVKNYQGWEKQHFVPEVGLFWQTGHDDGMEININSRQTADTVRGAPAYRPTLNSYLWADALAIARVAELAGDRKLADEYRAKAARLKDNLQKKLWGPKREFFFPKALRDEARDGFTVKALSLTYQTGKHAGSPHGREEIGYVPWQFDLPDPGYEAAWKFLMDKDYFAAEFGPTTVERHDPLFVLSKTCCWWSGQSWPYATTQTLKAMANLLHDYKQDVVTKADYLKLLGTFAKMHRKGGRPYIAEACHPDTGSWEGHDSFNHSEHYFHSGYCDLIVTGLVGLRPRGGDAVEVHPLAPDGWAYFALDNVPYRGRRLSVVWDRDGTRYKLGKGLHVLADGKPIASAEKLGRLTAKLPAKPSKAAMKTTPVNYAVSNDGHYFPRIGASYSAPKTSPGKLIDGNYWYHRSPPNRWTCEDSPNATDWVEIDFGMKRPVHTVKLYFLDDGAGISPPEQFDLEHWDGKAWVPVPGQERTPKAPTGRRANVVRFAPLEVRKLRAVFTHRGTDRTGLTEFEAWGDATLPVTPAPTPAGNLALNPGDKPFPKASASFTSRFDQVERANDGKVSFHPSPANRWTSYESPNPTDWLAIDFGASKTFARVELAVYDDGGGVRAPESYTVQFWDGSRWRDAEDQKRSPGRPAGGQFNEVRFEPVTATKVRVVFTHVGKSRSGVTEVYVWPD
ncbi:MAG TPA: discoidin domain-containing protein [Fimbriiglobus sp.]|nr:discoidin domain-containing protein [Fimbriiglobus sp.]